MKKSLLFIITLSVLSNISFAEITITDVKARPSIGTLKSSSIYMNIMNNDMNEDVLISANTEIADKCEIHKIVNDKEIHKMVKIDKLAIPGNNLVSLTPQNIHIMLMDLKQSIKMGEEFPLTLTFEKAGKIEVKAVVSEIKTNS